MIVLEKRDMDEILGSMRELLALLDYMGHIHNYNMYAYGEYSKAKELLVIYNAE